MALDKVKEKVNKVLGTFTGKCCDTNVFNNNDWRASREVFEKLMASDEYKRAMEYGHYIGFLGHPEDPDCQDDQNACIVMRDMRILDNGEVEGDFDLIDTPVGQIVKAFTDAGVKYGLSIRGLGDIDAAGEIAPEGFVFRGFDLVRFPAYDDCIPEFKALAASTDPTKKAKFQKVYAAINANIEHITSTEALELIQDPLAEGTELFNKIEDRIAEVQDDSQSSEVIPESNADLESIEEEDRELLKSKLDAMTNLYIDATARIRELECCVAELQTCKQEMVLECNTSKAKYSRMKRIVANQLETARQACDDADADNRNLSRRVKSSEKRVSELKEELEATKQSYKKAVNANTRLRERVSNLIEDSKADKQQIEAANHMNLKYKHKIEANSEAISQKDSAIEDIKRQLDETVIANKKLESRASNLDEENGELLSRVEAAEEMVLSYQQAYANIYANALGVYLKDLPVTAGTSVEELKQMIKAGTSTAGIPAAPSSLMVDEFEEDDEVVGNEDVEELEGYSAGMVNM